MSGRWLLDGEKRDAAMQLWLNQDSGKSGSPVPGAGRRPSVSEPLSGKIILLVEDEAMLAMELQFALEDAGAEVVGPALSLGSALGLVAQPVEIDAAILDVDIGGVDVFPVAQALELRGIPFVFHTGHGERLQLNTMFPAAPVITKPVPSDKLIEAIRRQIG